MSNCLPERVYYDLTFFNNTFLDVNSPVQYVPAGVTQTRDTPYLYNPEQYNMAIVRFSIDGSYIARVAQSPLSNTGTTGTRLWVSLSYNGVYYDEGIVFPTITSFIGKQEKLEYNIYGFLDHINDALFRCQQRVIAAGASCPYGQTFITYDPSSQLYQINIPSYYGTGTFGATGDGTIGVHMSYFLFQKLGSSFDVDQDSPLKYNNHDIAIVKKWRGDNQISGSNFYFGGSPTGNTGTYFAIKQDCPFPSSIVDLNRLIITTTTLPVVEEFKYRDDFLAVGTKENVTASVITDILIGKDVPLASRGEPLVYIPDVYRLVALKSAVPLNKADVQFFVADKQGFIYQLFLAPGSSINCKLLFLKKGLSN